MVETTLVILPFLVITLGMVDLGNAVFRHHVISQAARQGVRKAIVHGSLAKSGWNGGTWGPATFGPVAATDTNPKSQAVAPYLSGLDPSATNITMQWLDTSNLPEKRVRVTVTTTWTPAVTLVFGGLTRTLSASATMPIAH
jgi:Flp pilus assembly protein TadG